LSHPLYAEGTSFGEAFRAALHVADAKPAAQAGPAASDGLSGGRLPVGFGGRSASVLRVAGRDYPVPRSML
jgi:hypothetical protein